MKERDLLERRHLRTHTQHTSVAVAACRRELRREQGGGVRAAYARVLSLCAVCSKYGKNVVDAKVLSMRSRNL